MARAGALADVVRRKTGGNPFFVRQLLGALHRDGLLSYDAAAGAWSWDAARVATAEATEDVATLLQGEMGVLDQEQMRVILLNVRNQVLGTAEVYKGSVHTAVVRIAELFREALRQNAAALILVHNHPSGEPAPSADDISMTKQAIEAGRLLDVDVLDHIILAQGRFESMKRLGVAFA